MFVYESCLATFKRIYGKKEAMDNLIRSRINEEFHSQPEDICKDIAEKGGNSQYYSQAVGAVPIMIGAITLEAFLSILTLAVTFILGVIKAVLSYCAEVEAARQHAIEEDAIDQAPPATGDYEGLAWKAAINKITKSPIAYVAIAVVAWLFLKKN